SLLESKAGDAPEPLAEAADIYSRYLEKHPERRSIRARQGQLYLRQKKFSEAAAQLEAARAAGDRSLSVAKDLLQAYLSAAGSQQEKQEREGKEIALVQEILDQEEGNAEMRLLYGRLLMDRKQYREAAAQFRRSIELQPTSEAYANMASSLYLS